MYVIPHLLLLSSYHGYHLQGSSWEESTSKVEKILINGNESDCAYLAVTETDELGMYAVILCSRRDVRSNVKLDDKVGHFSCFGFKH